MYAISEHPFVYPRDRLLHIGSGDGRLPTALI